MKKMIVEMGVYDEKSKEKILKSVAGLPGMYKLYMELKEGTLIVIGNVNPVKMVTKLQKKWEKANLTLLVPYDEKKEAEMEAKEKIEEAFERNALFRSNRENLNYHHVPTYTTHSNIINDQEQGCVIC